MLENPFFDFLSVVFATFGLTYIFLNYGRRFLPQLFKLLEEDRYLKYWTFCYHCVGFWFSLLFLQLIGTNFEFISDSIALYAIYRIFMDTRNR